VRVRYYEGDAKSIWIYNYKDEEDPSQDVFINKLTQIEYNQRAKHEQTETDSRILGRQLKFIKETDLWVEREADKIPVITIDEVEDVIKQGYKTKSLQQQSEEMYDVLSLYNYKKNFMQVVGKEESAGRPLSQTGT